MWISSLRTLAAAAETFASFYNFWEMRLGGNVALVALASGRIVCPNYTSYSQVNLLF